jgi:predicted RNA-binding protein with PIN domain
VTRYLIDGNNVVGSRPDGWWRDRAGATGRLVALLAGWVRNGTDEVTVVFDGGPVDLGSGHRAGLEVVFAGRSSSADEEIARRAQHDADPAGLVVVTSDAGLAARLPRPVRVVGAGAFRRQLET